MVVLMDGNLRDLAEIVNCLPNREGVGTGLRVVVAGDHDDIVDVRLEPHRNERIQVGLRAIVVLTDDRHVQTCRGHGVDPHHGEVVIEGRARVEGDVPRTRDADTPDLEVAIGPGVDVGGVAVGVRDGPGLRVAYERGAAYAEGSVEARRPVRKRDGAWPGRLVVTAAEGNGDAGHERESSERPNAAHEIP